jgi:hypothetical protein
LTTTRTTLTTSITVVPIQAVTAEEQFGGKLDRVCRVRAVIGGEERIASLDELPRRVDCQLDATAVVTEGESAWKAPPIDPVDRIEEDLRSHRAGPFPQH